MKNIVERVFKLSDDKQLTQPVIKRFGEQWDNQYLDYYCHLVYSDTVPKQIFFMQISDTDYNKRELQNFVDLLKTIDYTDFDTLLLLVSTYPNCSCIFDKAKNFTKSKNSHLDNFLKETNGWLIYNYQLEKLYSLCKKTPNTALLSFLKQSFTKSKLLIFRNFESLVFDAFLSKTKKSAIFLPAQYMTCVEFNQDKAIEFRKNINKKHADSINKHLETKMFGTKFKDILTERMKLKYVVPALYNDAYELLEYLDGGNHYLLLKS
jgi:hypothetical protein